PRLAASIATPTPVAPPPTTIMSQGLLWARTRRHISARVMMEKSWKAFSNYSYPLDDERRQYCADKRADDRRWRVTPIGTAFGRNRKNSVRGPRSKIACGIDGVSGRATQ